MQKTYCIHFTFWDFFYKLILQQYELYKRNTCITVFQHPENADSDSEAEEDKLEELETLLKEHDPEFQKQVNS